MPVLLQWLVAIAVTALIGTAATVYFRNFQMRRDETAAGIFAPAEPATDPGDSVLGANQQRAILSAAILGRQVTEIKLRHRPSGVTLSLPVVSLRSLRNPRGEPGVVVLIARNPLR